jgi:hypothetical protein
MAPRHRISDAISTRHEWGESRASSPDQRLTLPNRSPQPLCSEKAFCCGGNPGKRTEATGLPLLLTALPDPGHCRGINVARKIEPTGWAVFRRCGAPAEAAGAVLAHRRPWRLGGTRLPAGAPGARASAYFPSPRIRIWRGLPQAGHSYRHSDIERSRTSTRRAASRSGTAADGSAATGAGNAWRRRRDGAKKAHPVMHTTRRGQPYAGTTVMPFSGIE